MIGGFLNTHVCLEQAALTANASASESIELAELWRALAGGYRKVVGRFADQQYIGLIVTEPATSAQRALHARERGLLEAVLSGVCQNRVAIENHLSATSIATYCRHGLETMGYRGTVSRVSPVLMRAASAATQPGSTVRGRFSHIVTDAATYDVVSIERPEKPWSRCFSRSELDVVARLLDGASYMDIASQRGTSVRTVANQIASAFRRMRVSGRAELVAALFGAAHDGGASPASELQTSV